MMIEAVSLATMRTDLAVPWPTVEGPVSGRESAFLLLHSGPIGGLARAAVGESAPMPGFGLESFASSVAALRLAAKRLIALTENDVSGAIRELRHLAPVAAAPAARHAIDLALHDFLGICWGVSVARLMGGPDALEQVPSNATIPRIPAAELGPLAARYVAEGVTTVKLKVGGGPLAEDLDRLRALRDAGGTALRIRIDANQAWTEDEAIAALRAMEPFRLEFAEQPVRADDIAALGRVRASCGVTIAADEAVRDFATAQRIVEEDVADILVVKPMVLGGLLPARTVACYAREHGLDVVVTAFLDTVVGRHGAAHLAASLGPTPYAHGIGAPRDFEHVLPMPSAEEAPAFVRLSREPGLGLNAEYGLARLGITLNTVERIGSE